MKLLLRWVFISALTLANAIVLAILAALLYARAQASHMMGRGPSASELAEPYIWLIIHSSAVGWLTLAATSLYWMAGLLWIPALRHRGSSDGIMKLSLTTTPLWFSLIFLLGRILLG